MTIDSKDIIFEMLENGGIYPGDPQASSIWSYENQNGDRAYAVFMHESHNDIHVSPYVRDEVMLWSRETGLTSAGSDWMAENRRKG